MLIIPPSIFSSTGASTRSSSGSSSATNGATQDPSCVAPERAGKCSCHKSPWERIPKWHSEVLIIAISLILFLVGYLVEYGPDMGLHVGTVAAISALIIGGFLRCVGQQLDAELVILGSLGVFPSWAVEDEEEECDTVLGQDCH